MNSLTVAAAEVYENYKEWVRRNPQTASELESTVRWLSYFVTGKINRSVILTELVYSASNLLVLFNDLIIQSTYKKIDSQAEKIKIWLTILEYSEVFLEISSKTLWGKKGKWITIVCIQLLKCVSKFILLIQHNERIILTPAIMPFKRNSQKNEGCNRSMDSIPRINNISFSLKRSGRVIRKVDSAPPLHSRLWKPPVDSSPRSLSPDKLDKKIVTQHLIGEILHIIKPIVVLGTIAKFGQSRWHPWVVSLAADLISLNLLQWKDRNAENRVAFSSAQKLEISRRRLSLLLYLMRSPFYDRHTKQRLSSFLTAMSQNVPLARLICEPLRSYIPHWQETYSYLWSS